MPSLGDPTTTHVTRWADKCCSTKTTQTAALRARRQD
ncbi:hypothetical protein PI125_g5564 [Phytophthora idaei]|nr:hypothetical protein PI125_g5564 [Phytophthora idaei]